MCIIGDRADVTFSRRYAIDNRCIGFVMRVMHEMFCQTVGAKNITYKFLRV